MLDYRCITEAPDEILVGRLSDLCTHVFADYGPFNFEDVNWVLSNMPDISIQTATEDEQLVGFKIVASPKFRHQPFG